MKKSKEDIQRYIAELEKQGIKVNTSAPPLYRMMWSFGVNVKPPLNQSFLLNTVLMGIYFGIFWGLFMWLFQWRKWQMSLVSAAIFSAAAGLLFGISMSFYYRWKSTRVKVPHW